MYKCTCIHVSVTLFQHLCTPPVSSSRWQFCNKHISSRFTIGDHQAVYHHCKLWTNTILLSEFSTPGSILPSVHFVWLAYNYVHLHYKENFVFSLPFSNVCRLLLYNSCKLVYTVCNQAKKNKSSFTFLTIWNFLFCLNWHNSSVPHNLKSNMTVHCSHPWASLIFWKITILTMTVHWNFYCLMNYPIIIMLNYFPFWVVFTYDLLEDRQIILLWISITSLTFFCFLLCQTSRLHVA